MWRFRVLILFALLPMVFFIGSHHVYAQDDVDYFDVEEPEEIPEPYYDEDQQAPPPMDEPDFIPPPVRPQDSGFARRNIRGGGNNANSAGSGSNKLGTTEGEIEFRLVDPPMYWVGDRKPPIPPPPKTQKK